MEEKYTDRAAHRDCAWILRGIGVLMLLFGLGMAAIAPLEMYCFYLFADGGRFYYPGAGFGSFIFANIACQIMGYYALAALFIPLGYGHLRLRRWARTLTRAALWFWLILGPLLVVAAVITLFAFKDLSLLALLALIPTTILIYPVAPGLLIGFYRSRDVRRTFEAHDPGICWTETRPLPVLVLGLLFLFYLLILQAAILFNGIFPLFGTLLFGMPGIVAIDVAMLVLIALTWGVLGQKRWAWWGAVLYFGLMTLSSAWAFSRYGLGDICAHMRFAPLELEAFAKIPFQGFRFAPLAVVPLLFTLGAIVYARRCCTQ